MESITSIYLIVLGVLLFIAVGISLRAFINWQLPGALSLGALMLTMSIWAGFYFLEIVHSDLTVKIVARKMLYLGMSLSPPFWLWYSLRYTGFQSWWSKHIKLGFLIIPGVIAFILGTTNEYHQLIWRSLTLSTEQGVAPLQTEYGALFWVFTGIAYGLITAGIGAYLITYLKSEKVMRVKTGVVLTGTLLTFTVNILFLFIYAGNKLDPTPLSFILSAPLIAFGFFRFGTTNLFPLAAPLVMEHLQDAIIILNSQKEVTDLNLAARKLLNMKKIEEPYSVFSALPELNTLRQLWDTPNSNAVFERGTSENPQFLDARIIPIGTNKDNPLGYVIILHDITKEQKLLQTEKLRSQHLSLLEETGRLIANSFDEDEILQRAVDSITQVFGYPETAISVVTPDHKLKVTVISGTEDFGYRPGYLQEFGKGIIGYTASIQKTYISGNVSKDPHYFSTSTRSGSAICIPIMKRGDLYGVLYVESFQLNAFNQLDVKTLETLASQISESLQRASLFAQTQKDLRTIAAIQNISKLVARSLDLQTISSTVVESLQEIFGYTHVSIYLLEEEYLHLNAQVGYPEELSIKKIHISQGVAGRCTRTKDVQFIRDSRKENVFLKADHRIMSEICVPLLKDDNVLGILNVESTEINQLTDFDVELLTSITGPLAVAVDNARLHTALKKMATTDAVTGLSNRHVFEHALVAEMERAQRVHSPLSLIIFDIDYFKEYNDQWGHPAGDARLRAVADIIKLNLRKYDIAARYGGDEFAVIMTNCDQTAAVNFAQRLRQGVHTGAPEKKFEKDIQPGYTLSIGIATYPQDASTSNELLIVADNAALRAKQQGKDRVKTANDYETT